jgi:hypothetical protein
MFFIDIELFYFVTTQVAYFIAKHKSNKNPLCENFVFFVSSWYFLTTKARSSQGFHKGYLSSYNTFSFHCNFLFCLLTEYIHCLLFFALQMLILSAAETLVRHSQLQIRQDGYVSVVLHRLPDDLYRSN